MASWKRRSFAHLGAFRPDATTNTDGIALTRADIGTWRGGVLYAIHDDQSVVALPWSRIAAALRLRPGYDALPARLGGFWDSMLGEGRRWWITSTSDSHRNWRDGGNDFWPGEYSKTYVHARRDYEDILEGIRSGRVFVTTGDLVSEVDVTARAVRGASAEAAIGGTLAVSAGNDVRISVRVRDPAAPNSHGDTPTVARVDLIVGEVTGTRPDRDGDTNATTRVVKRFTAAEWRREGEYLTMEHTLSNVRRPLYVRVRGTSTTEMEPAPDPFGEDPWRDLWFYSNPIFLEVR